jgi:Xaa-Pro aminopeptidase
VHPGFDYESRLRRARRIMREQGVDVLLLSVGADLPYFIGYEAMPLERLTMLVLPAEGGATLVVPRLEAPRVTVPGEAFGMRVWDEAEDPVAIVAGLAGSPGTVAVGDQTWSVFLLALQERLGVSFMPASRLTRELRMRKDLPEVDRLRRAGAAADRVVGRLGELRFSGRTERDVARTVSEWTVEEGHDAASFAIVASGPNGASPHHESSDRVIVPGDVVVVDFGGRHAGYHSDTTRMFSVGEPAEPAAEAFGLVLRAQKAAVAAIRPGVTAQVVDRAARSIIDDAGYGRFFVHRTGHGIGLDVHEDPYIVEGNETLLEPGMTFSVEPGVYLPGEFGIRIEDIVAVTSDGAERLNTSPRDLHVVG